MKIEQDVTGRLTQSRNAQTRVNIPSGGEFPSAASPASSGIIDRRSLQEALSIAHMSQTILTQALIISSQLRSIAINAMSSGTINNRDLQQTMSGISVISDAASSQGITQVAIGPSPTESVTIPDTKRETEELRKIAQALDEGKKVAPETITAFEKEIAEKKMIIDAARGILEARIGLAKGDRGARNPGEQDAQPIPPITRNPAEALTAQGNLAPERIRLLLG